MVPIAVLSCDPPNPYFRIVVAPPRYCAKGSSLRRTKPCIACTKHGDHVEWKENAPSFLQIVGPRLRSHLRSLWATVSVACPMRGVYSGVARV